MVLVCAPINSALAVERVRFKRAQALAPALAVAKVKSRLGTLTSRASPRSPTAVSSSRSRASRLGGLGMSGMSAPTPMPMLTARDKADVKMQEATIGVTCMVIKRSW